MSGPISFDEFLALLGDRTLGRSELLDRVSESDRERAREVLAHLESIRSGQQPEFQVAREALNFSRDPAGYLDVGDEQLLAHAQSVLGLSEQTLRALGADQFRPWAAAVGDEIERRGLATPHVARLLRIVSAPD